MLCQLTFAIMVRDWLTFIMFVLLLHQQLHVCMVIGIEIEAVAQLMKRSITEATTHKRLAIGNNDWRDYSGCLLGQR